MRDLLFCACVGMCVGVYVLLKSRHWRQTVTFTASYPLRRVRLRFLSTLPGGLYVQL